MIGTDIFNDYQSDLEKKRDGTAKARQSRVKSFLKWADEEGIDSLAEVDDDVVENHLTWMMDDYADQTVRSRYQTLSDFFQWMADEDGAPLVTNPMDEVDITEYDLSKLSKKAREMGQEVVYLSESEVEKLVDPNNVPDPTRRNELLIRLLYQTGIRSSEVRHIKLSDIDRDKRSITIRGKKTDSLRTVYYQPSLDHYLNLWLDRGLRAANEKAEESPYLFLTYKKKQMRHSTIRDVVKNAAHNAGIQKPMYEDAAGRTRWKVTPHSLRHTFAVHSVRSGMDIQRLALVMGHTDEEGRPNIDTTRVYLQFKDEAMRDAVRKHGPSVE